MKLLLLATLSLFTASAFSAHEKESHRMKEHMDKMSFEDAKKWKLESLNRSMTMIEEEKSCVNSATDKAGLKGCMDKMHAKHEEMKGEMKHETKKKM